MSKNYFGNLTTRAIQLTDQQKGATKVANSRN